MIFRWSSNWILCWSYRESYDLSLDIHTTEDAATTSQSPLLFGRTVFRLTVDMLRGELIGELAQEELVYRPELAPEAFP